MDQLLRAIDTDRTGKIDWTEFVAATLDKKHFMAAETLWATFRIFDRNGDNQISREELREVFKDANDEEIQWVVNEVDQDKDGYISYEEFYEMMTGEKAKR